MWVSVSDFNVATETNNGVHTKRHSTTNQSIIKDRNRNREMLAIRQISDRQLWLYFLFSFVICLCRSIPFSENHRIMRNRAPNYSIMVVVISATTCQLLFVGWFASFSCSSSFWIRNTFLSSMTFRSRILFLMRSVYNLWKRKKKRKKKTTTNIPRLLVSIWRWFASLLFFYPIKSE